MNLKESKKAMWGALIASSSINTALLLIGVAFLHSMLQEGIWLCPLLGCVEEELGKTRSHVKQIVAVEVVATTGIAAQSQKLID